MVQKHIEDNHARIKNIKLKEIDDTWTIWFNPNKNTHFIMKKTTKGKVSFFSLPNYKSNVSYTPKMCEQISKK